MVLRAKGEAEDWRSMVSEGMVDVGSTGVEEGRTGRGARDVPVAQRVGRAGEVSGGSRSELGW